jgi:glycosyltransferase involved in cell wall biosynthesis
VTGAPAPLVSVVLPVYNQAHLVDQAIEGVLSQTQANWELIVIDDGSTDDLEQRVRQYVSEPRVLFLRQPNQRLPAALNHALDYARGDLLTWTSADNIMLPTQLARLIEELAAHPDAGLVYSDYWAIDDQGGTLDDPSFRPHNRDSDIPGRIRLPSEVTIENFHRSGDNFIGASFLYRRAIAEIVGRYADDAFGGEDYDFWLRMHLVTQFHHVAEPLYKYRVHRDSLTSRAEELGLLANIRELQEADRWRIETLLTNGRLHSAGSLLRPVSQFHAALLKRCRPVAYSTYVARGPAAAPDAPSVVDIDLPASSIDAARLRHADILLCRSAATASALRREDWALDKRILTGNGEPAPCVQHAFIQAFADRVTAPVVAPRCRTLPQIDEPFRGRRTVPRG